MRADLGARKREIISELRNMAAERAQDGVFDKADVEELLARAKGDGTVETDEAMDLSFVRERYSGIMTRDACALLDGFLSNWISDQIAREARKAAEEKAREKKIETHIEKIELRLDQLEEWRKEVDTRMKDMGVDDKQRVLISQFFNLKHDD